MNMKIKSTKDKEYADYIITAQNTGWKSWLDVQLPYRKKLQKLDLGKTLDVGCGIGRNLKALPASSVGIDHNKYSINYLVKEGFIAYTVGDFKKSEHSKVATYDSLLFAHIIEHLTVKESKDMIRNYLKYLKKGGQVVIICPQKKGFSKDSTHITLHDRESIARLLSGLGLKILTKHSFPLPEYFGGIFAPNEYWVVGQKTN